MTTTGLRVAVVATAKRPDERKVHASAQLLERRGFTTVFGPHLFEGRHYFEDDERRWADFVWAVSDPSVDIIWLAKGGYGSSYCLPRLPPEIVGPKTVVGSSDATAILSALRGEPGVRLVHGPNFEGLASKVDDASKDSVFAALGGASQSLALTPLNGRHSAHGRMAGGNLTVLASLCGTPWAHQSTGAIVILEDVTELGYRLDRSLLQLRLSGALSGVAAFVLGDFERCTVPADSDFTLQQSLVRALEVHGVPMFAGLPVGHSARNLSWVVDGEAVIRDDILTWQSSTAHIKP